MSRTRHKTLRAFLAATRISQTELAALLGVSHSTVSYWAAGKRTPRLSVAVKLSRLTGIPVERLVAPDSNSTADAQVA